MRRLLWIFAVATLATGCDAMKSQDPIVTTTGNPPGPTSTKVPVTLEWAVSTGTVQGYKLEGSADGQTFFELGTVQANPGSSNIGVVVNLYTGATYYFRVRAFNQGGNSPFTSVTSVTI